MPKKILIIEDSTDISGALKMLIELEGYEAVAANSGLDGRKMAISEKPDLILMDLASPDLSGIDLTFELRGLPETADTPILCVSSHTEGIHSVVMAAGCQDVFSKASFIESFRPTLKKYLGE